MGMVGKEAGNIELNIPYRFYELYYRSRSLRKEDRDGERRRSRSRDRGERRRSRSRERGGTRDRSRERRRETQKLLEV